MQRRSPALGFRFLAAMVVSLAMGFSRPGGAMPSFTRATGEPCARCHAGFSRLRPYGASFLEHGYRTPSSLSLETRVSGCPGRGGSMPRCASPSEPVGDTERWSSRGVAR